MHNNHVYNSGLHLVIGILKFVSALYTSGSDVIELTDSNFESKVSDSINVWVVEFYAPWCGHCQNFAPEYSKAASALKVSQQHSDYYIFNLIRKIN